MILEILKMFCLVVLQNASFTLVSRARNSGSYLYNAGASVLSNGIWLLVIKQVVVNFGNTPLMICYVVAATVGSVGMQYIAIKHIEKPKVPKLPKLTTLTETELSNLKKVWERDDAKESKARS